TATSPASSTTTTTTSATGGGGGGFQCTTADQCPIPEDPCYEPKCTLGNCEFIPSEAGARCGEGFCDGAGICVACVVNDHCAPQICVDGLCVEGDCQDETLGGNETDVDCGGGACPACDNAKSCANP